MSHSLPPAADDRRDSETLLNTLRLSTLPGIGPRTLTSLLERFGDVSEVLAADESELSAVPGVGPKLNHTIRTASHHVDAEAILDWCGEAGVTIVLKEDRRYPRSLKELHDAPPLLFIRGDLKTSDVLSVAIVGTRHATAYGTRQANRLAYALAKAGITIVSGLARGIDTAAHQGAIDAGGRTLAVLGGGLGQVYPAENLPLGETIANGGAMISEFAPHAKPRAGMFPQRNRIIAAISLATLVIEAPDRSGALITANLAGELGRDVLALPGPVTSRASHGTHRLIRDGAILIQTVDDVLESLGPLASAVTTDDGHRVHHPAELKLNANERRVLESIAPEGTLIDQIIAACELPAHRVLATISVLEMRRLIRRQSGQSVCRI